MKACGIEIKNNEIIICLLSLADGLFDLPDCRVRRLQLKNSQENTAEHLKAFQFSVAKLVEDYTIEKLFIRERMMKGKFAGGALGFKLEASMQLIDSVPTQIIHSSYVKKAIKQNPLPILFTDTGLKIFQEVAFLTAYAGLVPVEEEK